MIRKAEKSDAKRLTELLHQVDVLHQKIRPDLFKENIQKYDKNILETMFDEDLKPIFVYEDEIIYGYVFCQIIEHKSHRLLRDIKTLSIDNICVDEIAHGKHIGKALYEFVHDYAKSIGCYNITLNVWEGNSPALLFYKNMGMQVQKTVMESIL